MLQTRLAGLVLEVSVISRTKLVLLFTGKDLTIMI